MTMIRPDRAPFAFELQMFSQPPADPTPPPPAPPTPPNPPPPVDPNEVPAIDADALAKLAIPELVKHVQDLRKENGGFRTRYQTERAAKTAAEAKLTDLQKFKDETERAKLEADGKLVELAKKDREALEAANAQRAQIERDFAAYRKVDAVRAQAMKLGIVDPTIVSKLIDVSGMTDDPAMMESAATEIATKFKTDYAYLFAAPIAPSPAPGAPAPPPPPRPAGGAPAPIDWSALTPEQFAAEEKKMLGAAAGTQV